MGGRAIPRYGTGTEYIRDYALMTIFCNWSFIKNHSVDKEKFRDRKLNWVLPLGGKRESHRVKSDHILTENDIEQHIPYSDAAASLTWDTDIHYPDPQNLRMFAEPFRSCAIHRGIREHYPVPYRCLYARDIKKMFLGGRILSTTLIAFACIRVMRTLGTLAEVCGLAAGICKRENCFPADVYSRHFDQRKALMERGVVIEPYHAYAPAVQSILLFRGANALSPPPREAPCRSMIRRPCGASTRSMWIILYLRPLQRDRRPLRTDRGRKGDLLPLLRADKRKKVDDLVP